MAWGLRITVVVYALLHFYTYFFPHPFLLNLLAVTGGGLLVSALVRSGIRTFKLPILLFAAAMGITLFFGNPVAEGMQSGFLLMRDIIGLLIIIPFISIVLREDDYLSAILRAVPRLLDSSRKLYTGMVLFTQVISHFLLFGVIPMLYEFVNDFLKNEQGEAWERFKGTALLRGFGLSTMWVISIPSFIFAVETMGASLWLAMLQGFFLAMVGTVISVLFAKREEKKYGVSLNDGVREELSSILRQQEEGDRKKAVEFVVLFVTLFGPIFLLHALFHAELMITIPLVIIVWSIAYYAVKKKGKKLLQESGRYVMNDTLGKGYQLSVMLSVGTLIYALNQTDFAENAVVLLEVIETQVPVVNFLGLLPFIVIFLGFTGLGPLTVMVLVAGILTSIDLPYPPELIVLAVTSGSVISIVLSPLIMPTIVLSGVNGINSFKNGIVFNWKFSLAFYVAVQVYVQGVRFLVT
ncbi:hypothetical protein [Salimicrobium halophilum]|uniref:Uncharacterized protein n=1 Tax=Salimicrobium halophilum TaxID=86666 RepID=A0A1G8VVN8_9BACI|nr:hypothetical protein [Salimicrobium halophilum]SDJ70039.1 hypothetical protein SAMN04490247_2897 [Salimicrobium halophilum]